MHATPDPAKDPRLTRNRADCWRLLPLVSHASGVWSYTRSTVRRLSFRKAHCVQLAVKMPTDGLVSRQPHVIGMTLVACLGENSYSGRVRGMPHPQNATLARRSARRAVDPWQRWLSIGNLRAVVQARRNGATVSLNQVRLQESSVGRNTVVMGHVILQNASLGEYSVVGPYASFFWAQTGAFCGFAQRSTVGAVPHYPDRATSHEFAFAEYAGVIPKGEVDWKDTNPPQRTIVGADVWMGTGATIRSGVRVGHGAVIAAGAVVTREVHDYEIVGGVPARRLRMRFPDSMIDRLLQLQWWSWPTPLLAQQAALFRKPLDLSTLEALEDAAP